MEDGLNGGRGGARLEGPRRDVSPSPTQRLSGNERLYEAYNDLHALAQAFEKPFDAPAILVVGHQTDGKSALVEALMGFQFNSVGGGTKTRRPIALHMQYNASCSTPRCFLFDDSLMEKELGLEELQFYIEAENSRLEAQQMFCPKEIICRIEYKYCPNLTIIDTPGLISAAPGKANAVMQGFSAQVEAIVRGKLETREHIIMCLEDTNDWNNATTRRLVMQDTDGWNNATTRRLVMQADPTLSRTVLVSTKFDTKLPQFARGADVEMFLHPAGALGLGDRPSAGMLADGPFFTSVPSGRIGSDKDSRFRNNDEFRAAIVEREAADVSEVESKMNRRLSKEERTHLGVAQLRGFLEQLLQRRYLESVPTIVPMLEKETRSVQAQLDAVSAELSGLQSDKLKDKGRVMVEAFVSRLLLLLRGTAVASPDKFGETLADEQARGGAFCGANGRCAVPTDALPNAGMRLFGGAQFHRALTEFKHAAGQITCPPVTREEITNACGIDDMHDGVNYIRTACVIATARSQEIFEPLMHQLGKRLSHVVRRLMPIALHLMQRNGQLPAGHELFLTRLSSTFSGFIEETEKACKHRVLEDLQSTTRYVSWSLHTKGASSLRTAMQRVREPPSGERGKSGMQQTSPQLVDLPGGGGQVLDLLESTLWNHSLGATSEDIVSALVGMVFCGIRDYVVQCAELKFNCFFLMPLVDTFPLHVRSETERALDAQLEDVFDATAMRASLAARREALSAELRQVETLQRKFSSIHVTLVQQTTSARGGGGGGGAAHAAGAAAAGGGGSAGGAMPPRDPARDGGGGGGGRKLDAHMLSLTESFATGTVMVSAITAAAAAASKGGSGSGALDSVQAKASPLAQPPRKPLADDAGDAPLRKAAVGAAAPERPSLLAGLKPVPRDT
ncbi:hypothetical protein FOA52_008300 [Chlamydomonas sp. UWO 241]|nr:hypothetical protein FOA52_008300 [Chlamydomonas sp. UWO 241]